MSQILICTHKCGGSSNIFKRNNLKGYPINRCNQSTRTEASFDKNLSKFASNALKLYSLYSFRWNYFVSHFVTDGFFLNDLFKQVICFREPLKRYISVLKHDEYQHKIYNYEQFKHIDLMWKRTDKTFFINYNKDNYYVAMLNFGDVNMSTAGSGRTLGQSKIDFAAFFESILIYAKFILLEKYGITNALD